MHYWQKNIALLILSLGLACTLPAQEFMPLWPQGKKPGSNGKQVTDSISNERIWRVNTPGIYTFPATKAENTRTAVLICPGGGYERVSYIYNGFNLAQWFNAHGVNVYVLLYRLPHQQDLSKREIAPLQDAQRAVKLIRSRAGEWNIEPDRIGIMGISAGGHVAAMTATHRKDETLIDDPLDQLSCRPDFMILLSPVITMGPFAHKGSKKNLLGPDTSATIIKQNSAEEQVTATTPPAFMVHALNDSSVKVQNSLLFHSALIAHKVNASIHIFPQGGHSIRLVENPGSAEFWTDLLYGWMKEMNFITPKPFR